MRLSLIRTDTARYQRRRGNYAPQTVEGIVAEGIDLAKFDPIPITQGVVAGDGHSRLEACRQLHALHRLPPMWILPDGDAEIPTREVSETEADRLRWTANLSRAAFNPVEEAAVYREMLDSGLSESEVSILTHQRPEYIRRMLPLNELCHDIAERVGANPDAGGLDKYIAQILAASFVRHNIAKATQQQLWHDALKHADLSANFIRGFMARVGEKLAGRATSAEAGMLFASPPNAKQIVEAFKGRADALRQAQRGIAALLKARTAGVLDGLPELTDLLDRQGRDYLERIANQSVQDGQIVGALCCAA